MNRRYPNVRLGKDVVIEEFVILGKPPAGAQEGEFETVIGDYSVIRSHTVIYAGTKTGSHFQTGHHALIREHNTIGDDVSVGSSSVLEHHIVIEDGARIHSQVFVCEFSHLKKKAWLGPNVVLTNAKYPRYQGVKDNLVGCVIGEDAKIGANSTLLPGIKIGAGALVGAGSVVTKDVAAETIVAGNPAVFLKKASDVSY